MSWRVPYIVQVVPAAVMSATVWFIPESPRWLFAKQKDDVAKSVLIKYHGNGNPDSAVVRLECEKIKFSLEAEAELTRGRWWDYKILIRNRANRYRMWILVLITVFSQFTGGAVISYFLPCVSTRVFCFWVHPGLGKLRLIPCSHSRNRRHHIILSAAPYECVKHGVLVLWRHSWRIFRRQGRSPTLTALGSISIRLGLHPH